MIVFGYLAFNPVFPMNAYFVLSSRNTTIRGEHYVYHCNKRSHTARGERRTCGNGIRRGAGVMARHGAFTRMFKVISGAGARDLNLQSFYSSFTEGVAAFKIFSADPKFHALFKEQASNSGGDIRGPNI